MATRRVNASWRLQLASCHTVLALALFLSALTVRATEPNATTEPGLPGVTGAFASVTLTDGTVLRTDAPRYRAETKTSGNRTVIRYHDTQGQLDQCWTITALDDRCFTFLLKITNTSAQSLTLKEISPLEATLLEKHDPARPHVLLNADSTSRPLPTRLEPGNDSIRSAETIALESPSVAAGSLTGKHNYNHFTMEDLDGQPVLRACGYCSGCLLRPKATRESDLLFVSLHERPLEQMERYADLAGKINNAKIWPPRVAWCSWYAGWMHAKSVTYRGGLQKGVEENIPQVKRLFADRGGLHTMRICDDYQPHGDWPNVTGRVPGGFDRLARLISEAGIIPGIWYAPYWASTEAHVFKEHPEWFTQTPDGSVYVCNPWGGKPKKRKQKPGQPKVTTSPESSESPRILKALYNAPGLAVFDTSRPDVQQYFEDTARAWRERGFRYVTNDYLAYGVRGPAFYDRTMTKIEVLRAGLEAVRRGLGDDVFYRTIGGPTGVRMGLANDLRISGDSHGDNPAAYFRTAQVWFYHRRLWLNDPSAVVCARYGELKPIEWNRLWMSWIGLSGTVMTYGEVLDELPEQYIKMYQRLFPPLPVAGRPLDIWENDPYMLWGMDPGEADGPYTLFGVFDVTGEAAGRVRLNLDEIAARSRGWDKPATAPGDYVLWDFWNERLLTGEAENLTIDVKPKSGRIFALRPRLGRPQLLGTRGHFSQGVVETQALVWNPEQKLFSGKVRGNGGDATVLYFLVPESMQLTSAALGRERSIELAPRGPGVLALDVPPTDGWLALELRFEGTPLPAAKRPFQGGRAATHCRPSAENVF